MTNKVFTLVMTDGNFMDVQVFYGEQPPLAEEMLPHVDFPITDELKSVLRQLHEKLDCTKDGDYACLRYTDCGKEYLFHLKCHDPAKHDYTVRDDHAP